MTRDLIIKNRNGLHARPAAMFVKIASRYNCEVWIEKDGERVNGKSIMGLLMLAAGQGSTLALTTEGDDEQEASDELHKLVESSFGEG
ncbi:MAG: HPr family phosphocarrier protein [Chthoniobacterales bacterium]